MLLAAVTQTVEEPFRIHDILRAVSGTLEVPVVVLLVVFLLAAAALVGWLIAEYCTERRHLKVALPSLMEALRTAESREAVLALLSALPPECLGVMCGKIMEQFRAEPLREAAPA